ncbi:hypothetical protein L7F22_033279 [Adiantum nelumboides]|nr:hypothetical protein [Adiantum nelumboides]
MPRKPNLVWDVHTNVIRLVTTPGQQGLGTRHWQCKYCGESQTSTITRALKHLTGIGTANHCHGCERIPPLVKEELIREHFSAAYGVPSRGSSMSQDALQDALLGDLGDSHVDAGMSSGQQTSQPSSGDTKNKSCSLSSLPVQMRARVSATSPGKDYIHLNDLSISIRNELWKSFNSVLHVIHAAGNLGVVVFQFHLSFKPTKENQAHVEWCRENLDQCFSMAC